MCFESGRFMTLFYLTIDPGKRRLEWVRAGHDPALIYDPARDEFEELKGSGVALGVNDNLNYEQNHRSGLTERPDHSRRDGRHLGGGQQGKRNVRQGPA